MMKRTTEPDLPVVAGALADCLAQPGFHFFLFGSRAKGTARPTSDWDLGVLGPRPLTWVERGRMREMLEEWPTLHTMDLVDLTAAKPAFREHVMKHAVLLVREAA